MKDVDEPREFLGRVAVLLNHFNKIQQDVKNGKSDKSTQFDQYMIKEIKAS